MITVALNRLSDSDYELLRQSFEDETSCVVYFGNNEFIGVNTIVLPEGLEILEEKGVWIYGRVTRLRQPG